MIEEKGEKGGGRGLRDMDPDKRERSVMHRADNMFATLTPPARRRVMQYLVDKYSQTETEARLAYEASGKQGLFE